VLIRPGALPKYDTDLIYAGLVFASIFEMLARFFRPTAQREAAYRLYGRIVEAARRPEFFAQRGVPDTLDGRFELIALHASLVFRRLAADSRARDFSQELFDAMFADLDRALREMGAGDLGVGKHVKRMVSGFYGRARAYERALGGAEKLEPALRRNLYGTTEPKEGDVAAVAAWMHSADAVLGAQKLETLLAGEVAFPEPPATGERT
jgi:cytochrome b pre-mRNA-processing protein 3